MTTNDNSLFIEDDGLYEHAAASARQLKVLGERPGRRQLRPLRRGMAQIGRIRDELQRQYADEAAPAACQWLLDNAWLARQEYLCAEGAFREAKHLRSTQEGPLILALCRVLLQSGRNAVTEERCRLFLDGFQSVTVLRRAELQLFPAALRAAALEALADTCRRLRYAADQAALAPVFEALFSTLRWLSMWDAEKLLNAADVTGAVLAADPSGDFSRMDSGTRQMYLERVARLARREGMEEHSYAKQLIRSAKLDGEHVGTLLFEPPGRARERLYIVANVLLTLCLSLGLAISAELPGAALLLLLPVSELVKGLLDLILAHLTPRRRVPRMETKHGIPPEGRTVCVLSCLLTDPESAEAMAARLEELRLVCRSEGENLCFGLLADLPEAAEQTQNNDGAILDAAAAAVRRLNGKYGGGFTLFTRKRSYNGENWSGFDRKRGALLELARLLCGEDSALEVTGEKDALAAVRYILTLDSDTRLYPGAAGELVGAMLHPLNRPRIDPERGIVTEGYAVMQPRLSTELKSAGDTDFALIFAGPGGCDAYGTLAGELYMDAFASSGFAGKGILDARALLQCTGDLPAGRILSHDAVESALLRCALVGDAEASDAFPARPLAYFKRLHRWVRGDWQNLPFLFHRALAPLDRWRLLENLRRSLLPPMTLLSILAGFFLPGSGLALSAWAALLALLSRLLITLAEGSLRQAVRMRRYTRLLTGVGGAIVQTFIRLWLLPFEAWVCLSAMGTALWRMFVSHRRLLQWQTAAQSERGSGGFPAHLRAFWQSILLGLALLLFSPVIIGKSAGLLWLLSPVTAFALALPARKDEPLSAADREYLRAAAGDAWRYFTACCTAEDHYLPPDHDQVQPPLGLAHRSSPTNMGLAMAAAVAAAELELTGREEAAAFISRMLGTLERLPKRLGHLYNWYDTRTLLPLPPLFLSTVDSGNLCAALIAVGGALGEWGMDALSRRAGALADGMDFLPLFDEDRCLFYICYDTEKDRGAGGWYDLMASEAMLTSYLAVARGDVPKKHWRRLSRGQLQKDGYRGLASWTGTMFEYLMPQLFLPLYRSSLLYESGRFCLYAQKRQRLPGKPWGLSESAYYAFGPDLEYRYKASGCAALALKRGQEADFVIAPYASFLALTVDPQTAVSNLRHLERCGAVGRFGFMEALDFTPERCEKTGGERVDCYMAHHIGMSIIAAANALCGGVMQRHFFRNPSMRAYSLLLQERLPDSPAVLRRDGRALPERPQREAPIYWRQEGLAGSGAAGACLLSNGVYQLRAGSGGDSTARCGELTLYAPDGPRLRFSINGKPLPDAPPARWVLAEDRAVWDRRMESLSCREEIFAAAGELGEGRLLSLETPEGGQLTLTLRLRPVLAAWRDYQSHPAFWQLGLEAEALPRALLIHRFRRGEHKGCWLCLSCSAELRGSFDAPDAELSVPLRLKPGERSELRLAFCFAWDRESALAGAERILREPLRADLTGAAGRRLGMDAAEIGAAMALLRPLDTPLGGAVPKRELWPYGISGDVPILCCEGRAREALPLLNRFLLLKSCGQEGELVYFTAEQGEYRQPLHRRIAEALARQDLEALLGSRGGIHFAPMEARDAVESRAAFSVGALRLAGESLTVPPAGGERLRHSSPPHRWVGDAFLFDAGGKLPGRVWQHILTNGRMGCIAADCGPAAMWLENARELPLVPPMRELRGVQPPEGLWAELDGERVSLFAANDGRPCTVRFSPGLARWEKEIAGRQVVTELFFAREDARLILITGAEGLPLCWEMRLQLGPEDASGLRAEFSDGLFRAENPECWLDGTVFLAGTGENCLCRTEFTPPAMRLSLTGQKETVLACGCCEEAALRRLFSAEEARRARRETTDHWQEICARLRFSTGSVPMDRYLNRWAVYQTLACRLLARCSLYQQGGAYGFRDQLQDAANLLPLDPAYARERILDCCRHQYVEGDVMHWWHPHPEGDKGVRTRCSDDLLWLPWALCEYIDATGDTALCAWEEPYLSSPPLGEHERDRYETPEQSGAASVLFHARAALDRCIGRGFGDHGLPLFGSGDWNDGLDAVDGESVWLGFFLSHVAERFAALLERLGQDSSRYRACAGKTGRAANAAWNGRWFRRGYWADGSPLGGDERIDALPQAWAAFCNYADPDRVDAALEMALERLVDRRAGLVKLFDPPFGEDERYPGYLAGYGPGLRENGGQYTHGAIWLALACLKTGKLAQGRRILELLVPDGHDPGCYEAEPFVLPADVSSAPDREGEAGWTWYTGSAGWYLRACEQWRMEEAKREK